LYSKTRVIITGEIIDFNNNSIDNNIENDYSIHERNGYTVGERIYLLKNKVYVIGKIEKLDINTMQIEIDSNFLSYVRYEDAFRLRGDFKYKNKSYSVGDNIQMDVNGEGGPSGNKTMITITGIAVGLNDKYALVLDKNRKLFRQIKITL
jgi:hypothetical protein